MVGDALRGYLALAGGVTEVTAARARAAARVLVEQGEATGGQVTALAEDLVATSRRNREGLLLIVRHEIETTLRRLGLGTAGEVEALTERVRRLEQSLRALERGVSGASGTSAAKKASTQRATAKKPAAKKAATKRTAATKASARKTTSTRAGNTTGRRS